MPWICKNCATSNPDGSGRCFVCDAVREYEETAEVSSQQNPPTRGAGTRSRGTRARASTSTSSSASTSSSTSTRTTSSASTRSSTSTTSSTSTSSSESVTVSSEMRGKLFKARMCVSYSVICAAIFCGLVEQLRSWEIFQWIVGLGGGCVLLLWAICICTNSVGHFVVNPKSHWGLIILGVGILINTVLYYTINEGYKVVFMWFMAYCIIGGIILMRWAFTEGKKKISRIAIAETIVAILLLGSSPLIALIL